MTTRELTMLASIMALVGCSEVAGPAGEQALQVTVRVVGGVGGSVAVAASPGALAAASVDIERVALVLGGLKLETAGTDGTKDWVFAQSVVVPLDLAGEPVLVFDTGVPAGTYKELEVSVDKLEAGNPAEESLIAAWPELADASVLVAGTVTSEGASPRAFTFTAPLDIDLELPFESPIVFAGDGDPVTLVSLAIDLSGWFLGTGGLLDPSDPANRSAIESNIEASVEVHQVK